MTVSRIRCPDCLAHEGCDIDYCSDPGADNDEDYPPAFNEVDETIYDEGENDDD